MCLVPSAPLALKKQRSTLPETTRIEVFCDTCVLCQLLLEPLRISLKVFVDITRVGEH